MMGDERVRFCRQCSLNVYNLSSMSRGEAERLISNAEGRLCIRYYKRSDGTVLTRNCPVGLRAIRRRLSRAASATLSAVLGFFAGLGIHTGTTAKAPSQYFTTMGAIAMPEEKSVNVNDGKYTEIVGGYAYEEGQMELPARKNYRTVKRAAKKARR
jgi:hypothetical protein